MSRLDSHVATVQRRMTYAILVDWLAICAFVLTVLALLLIIAQRAIHFDLPISALWIGVGLGAVVAFTMTLINRPNSKTAAVALDERLNLKEKFSTALAVRSTSDPFEQAVVRDAENTAQSVRLAGQFNVPFPTAGYWAIAALVITILVAMFFPQLDLFGRQKRAVAQREEQLKIAENKQMVKEAIAKIEAIPHALADNEQVKLAKAELAKMLEAPGRDTSKTARRIMDAMDKADQGLKEKAKENKNFAQAQANQKMFKSMNVPLDQKGPVADAHRDLVKGDYEEAVKKLDQAVKELDKMDPNQKKEAAQQMENLAQQLQQMAQDQKAMEKVAEQMKQNGTNQQQIKQMQQAMQQAAQGDKQAQQQVQQMQQQMAQQMQQQGMNQQQIQQMQQQMQQAQQAANAQAQAQAMAQAAQQMAQAMAQAAQQGQPGQQGQQAQQQAADAQKQMQQMLQQMQAMAQDAQQIQQMQQAMQQAMAQAAGQCDNPGNNPNGQPRQGEWKAGDPNGKQGPGQGGPGQGWGGQGQKSAAPYSVKDEQSKSYYDEKGKHLASVYVKDRSIKGESKLKLQEVIKAGQADEGDDVDDSRADRRTQEVQRRYFKVMEDELKK